MIKMINSIHEWEKALHTCPICKSNCKIIIDQNAYHVECIECHLRSREFDLLKEMVQYWNNRKKG